MLNYALFFAGKEGLVEKKCMRREDNDELRLADQQLKDWNFYINNFFFFLLGKYIIPDKTNTLFITYRATQQSTKGPYRSQSC
jgi:hypothetical protein